MMHPRASFLALLTAFIPAASGAPTPGIEQRGVRAMLENGIDRPLRYTPDGTDIVIRNGGELFNRPLYGGSSPFRVDGGDLPEFSFYLPGRGGNVRFGIRSGSTVKWLNQASAIESRYRHGWLVHRIQDPLLGPGGLTLTTLCPGGGEGLLVRAETAATGAKVELVMAYGGIQGERGGRDGDIGCERVPVREFFRFKPEYCEGNRVLPGKDSAIVQATAGSMILLFPRGSVVRQGDAAFWNDPSSLFSKPEVGGTRPIAVASFTLTDGVPAHIGFQHLPAKQSGDEVLKIYQEVAAGTAAAPDKAPVAPWTHQGLGSLFDKECARLEAIASHVVVDTPDPFVNAAVPSLNIASDAVWDARSGVYLHGGVAWRTPLLGWRVAYSGDTLGWHERTRAHFDRYAKRQNVSPVPDRLPEPEPEAFLARNENALHSNGDMTSSHYDMNLVGIDTIFRHLLWTGDLDYARSIWPVIERHLAWEQRLFRREFGPEKLPLYEAYCCIWASDSLAYNGGGGAHSTAYNLYHHRMAARIARLIGKDPAPYEAEAARIHQAMERLLWLKDRGWFAEWKDLLGDQSTHEEAAAWTFYHTVDSEVPDPFEAWQMSRFVKTRLPHIPVRGPGVPEGFHTISTTSWMPWIWSLNNVVMGESMHTAHALWQAGDPDSAFRLFKGALLDSMYLGLCPGNVGMCTWYDANRRESQRDFGDGVGATSRAFVEGLFGIMPDLLAGELRIRPGFPVSWGKASIRHPSLDVSFLRRGGEDSYKVVSRLSKPVAVRLTVPAFRDQVAAVTANGKPVDWTVVGDSVAVPRIEVLAPAAPESEIVIRWAGAAPVLPPAEVTVKAGAPLSVDLGAGISETLDPQLVLDKASHKGSVLSGVARGTVGHRTVFARVGQGRLQWWQPVSIRIEEKATPASIVFRTDWSKRLSPEVECEPVPLGAHFNSSAASIFKQDYKSPRPAFCSLSLPRHGYGSWCHPKDSFEVDDSGIRALAAKNQDRILLPNGVPLATPGDATAPNIAFVSRWDNFPRELSVPLSGRASRIHLLMAGSTDAMKSRRDNGEILITYTDGSSTRLALENPTTWWPIDQDYFIDDFAFRRPGPLPVRVDLKTGKIRVLEEKSFAGKGRPVPGGAATVLDVELDSSKELKSLTVRAIANEVVIGLMSATLQRP